MLTYITLHIGLVCQNGNLNDMKEQLLKDFEELGCYGSTPFVCSYNPILKEESDDTTGKLPSLNEGHHGKISLTHDSKTESSEVSEVPCES
jgi:hypothetical protein